ncbi:sulfotransferase domain-containing protein [Microbacter sp. GSS18]|nr:sulfotransferase domain-containing protein [Microbacter sp. GSS18]
MPRDELDFVVIGAAKSGTTSLYAAISQHPGLFIPSEKEVPFFNDPRWYRRGFDAYMRTYFSDVPDGQAIGTVTPQYMLDTSDGAVRQTALRMSRQLPGARLVVILRNPVDRAYSHYKMRVQRGYEQRSFDDVVDQAIAAGDGPREGAAADEHRYVFGSEYGRIIGEFLRHYPREALLILTTKQLRDDPVAVSQSVFAHIGVDDDFVPADADKTHREGGSAPKVRVLTPGFLFGIPGVQWVWRNAVPARFRKRVEYRLNLWNIKADDLRLSPDDQAYRRLMDYLADDLAALDRIEPGLVF